ncbi:MAG TPA: DUF1080 domain-containing protein [Verrucomicrobiae bacterium]|jgi:hypothetical protein|nr:DUF1080 domain-containing protein [Verrucomicrobiae bacterium]
MRTKILALTIVAASALAGMVSPAQAENTNGYTDTPMLPSGKWHVHDPARPAPPVVTPGKTFSDGAGAPSDATVLFDGTDLSKWSGEKGEARWKVENGYMEVAPGTGQITTKDKFGDFQLHLEFAEPEEVHGNSQERGNSGVFLHGIYEIQVLDCYDNPTYSDGQTASIYGQSTPLINACRKPGEWQTYDIVFEGPRFDGDKKLTRPARVTVIHNGIVVQNHQPILGPTGHRTLSKYTGKEPERGPLALQDHHNKVRYRNIWIREIQDEEQP